MKIIQALEETKKIKKTIKNETKEQEGGFLNF